MPINLDIIVCTYDREEILLECISSLLDQEYDCAAIAYSVLVVNNAPKPFSSNTRKLLEAEQKVRTIHESQPGLSIARNAGLTFVNGNWIAFMDDDALVPRDYVQHISDIVNEESWDCFGGHINSWWKYGRPDWLHEGFGSKPKLSRERILLTDGYNWGSNIIIKKTCINHIGGFPTSIGMKGKSLGYAAENIVQDQLREQGYVIGYDPNLFIDHLVMPQKLKLNWHIRSTYATGRDGRQVYPNQYGLSGMLLSIKNCISRPLKALLGWLARPSTPPKKVYLDIVKPYALLLGKVASFVR